MQKEHIASEPGMNRNSLAELRFSWLASGLQKRVTSRFAVLVWCSWIP